MAERYYDRRGSPISETRWHELRAEPDYARIIQTKVGGTIVSTFWVGVAHDDQPPKVFETMTFSWDSDRHAVWRYRTETEARAGHVAKVRWLRTRSRRRLWMFVHGPSHQAATRRRLWALRGITAIALVLTGLATLGVVPVAFAVVAWLLVRLPAMAIATRNARAARRQSNAVYRAAMQRPAQLERLTHPSVNERIALRFVLAISCALMVNLTGLTWGLYVLSVLLLIESGRDLLTYRRDLKRRRQRWHGRHA